MRSPYRSAAPALTDLLGGQVQIIVASTAASIEYVRAGKLRALAVAIASRLEALPDIPTVDEFVPGYEASGGQGIGIPRKTPAEIIDRIIKEIDAGLADPKLKARHAEQGGTVLVGSPADFGKFFAGETEKGARWSNSPASSRGDRPIGRSINPVWRIPMPHVCNRSETERLLASTSSPLLIQKQSFPQGLTPTYSISTDECETADNTWLS